MKKKIEKKKYEEEPVEEPVREASAFIIDIGAPQVNTIVKSVVFIGGIGVLDDYALACTRPEWYDTLTGERIPGGGVPFATFVEYWRKKAAKVTAVTIKKAAAIRAALEAGKTIDAKYLKEVPVVSEKTETKTTERDLHDGDKNEDEGGNVSEDDLKK